MTKSEPTVLEGDHLLHLVEPQKVNATDVKGCVEIRTDVSNVSNPFFRKGGEEREYISPHELMDLLINDGWKVVTVAYKRKDGTPNFGHEPTINHVLVAVLIKV
ncbi:MAG: hypothetical protein QY304_01265 [Candidatus Paceibacterota bacterium]|nr:MAG: hypothetical protein QY304_01265 [Candidatus Paceibacterota bacterium]